MKWLLYSSNNSVEVYELWNSDEKLLNLNFYQGTGTSRISTMDEKRVFRIGRKGFLRSRTILRNEYGVSMAQLNAEGSLGDQGTLEVFNQRFTYLIPNLPDHKVEIFKNGEKITYCELPVASKDSRTGSNYDVLILILSWYMTSKAKEQVPEYVRS